MDGSHHCWRKSIFSGDCFCRSRAAASQRLPLQPPESLSQIYPFGQCAGRFGPARAAICRAGDGKNIKTKNNKFEQLEQPRIILQLGAFYAKLSVRIAIRTDTPPCTRPSYPAAAAPPGGSTYRYKVCWTTWAFIVITAAARWRRFITFCLYTALCCNNAATYRCRMAAERSASCLTSARRRQCVYVAAWSVSCSPGSFCREAARANLFSVSKGFVLLISLCFFPCSI